MSSVLVVVIVGVVIAAIVGATLQDRKPATPAHHAERDPEPVPPPPPARSSPPGPWVPAERPADLEPVLEPVLDQRGVVARVRAGVLLALTVVVLGSLAAGCIGGALYLGGHVLNRTLR